jgi:hypothetical protein
MQAKETVAETLSNIQSLGGFYNGTFVQRTGPGSYNFVRYDTQGNFIEFKTKAGNQIFAPDMTSLTWRGDIYCVDGHSCIDKEGELVWHDATHHITALPGTLFSPTGESEGSGFLLLERSNGAAGGGLDRTSIHGFGEKDTYETLNAASVDAVWSGNLSEGGCSVNEMKSKLNANPIGFTGKGFKRTVA